MSSRAPPERPSIERLERGVALLIAAALCACKASDAGTSTAADAGAPSAPSALPQSCARAPASSASPAACNGAPELCDRSYAAVVTPVTHNAMSSVQAGFGIPNQTHDLSRQLADGVRGMMLDLHYFDPDTGETDGDRSTTLSAVDDVYLCHTSCSFGKIRALDAMCTIGAFLDANPGEIVTLDLENHVADADTDAVLRASGLADLAYAHALGTPWPTLGEMLAAGKRLVVFVEQNGGSPPYLHPAYKGEIWDTPYDFETEADFTCALGRGTSTASPLFLINHWLSNPLSDIGYAREVNVEAVLGKRVDECTTAAGRKPTFVAVDFYEVGDLFQVVKTANGL